LSSKDQSVSKLFHTSHNDVNFSIKLTNVSPCNRWAVGVCKYDGTKTAGIDILHENMIESIEILNLESGPPSDLGRCFGEPESRSFSLTKTSPGVFLTTTTGNPDWIAAHL